MLDPRHTAGRPGGGREGGPPPSSVALLGTSKGSACLGSHLTPQGHYFTQAFFFFILLGVTLFGLKEESDPGLACCQAKPVHVGCEKRLILCRGSGTRQTRSNPSEVS